MGNAIIYNAITINGYNYDIFEIYHGRNMHMRLSIQFKSCIHVLIRKGVNTHIYQWQHYNISQHDIK